MSNFATTCQLGMCNSDQALEYSAVTAMIDHENDDRGFYCSDCYSSTLGGTLSSDCLAGHSMRSKDVRRKRSMASKSRRLVMPGLATYMINLT